MSFSREKKQAIKNYILQKIGENDRQIAKKTAQAFEISLNSVYRYISVLEEEGVIKKEKGKPYQLQTTQERFTLSRNKDQLVYEDEIYADYIYDHIKDLPENAVRIWSYGFSEMMNNVIDHSRAETVTCDILKNKMETTIVIHDDGEGIFRHIKEYYGFRSLEESVQELFKGKLTTDKKHHSGEGIFFTSRMMDFFAALSDGIIFTHDNFEEAVAEINALPGLASWETRSGTTVVMTLSNTTSKTPAEIFHEFEDEEQNFSKTSIKVSHLFGPFPVSRSQAKRLCKRFDEFSEVLLDFSGVDEIGQGFAHELFGVYQVDHEATKIIVKNANEAIDTMIRHVSRH